jgi:phosphatidylcholine synthase
MTPAPLARRLAAWGVHAYTALGLPLALAQIWALQRGAVDTFWLLNWTAVWIDATDGAAARAVDVRRVVPTFDGRKLDDIVDFLTFSLLPALALPALGLVPESWRWLAAAPVLASGYGFCRDDAKTEDSFVGFPSYWNIVLFYLWRLSATPAVTATVVLLLAALVFVRIHFVYPTKAQLLKRWTIGLGGVWALAVLAVAASPRASWAVPLTWLTLAYPAYYAVLSAVHHRRVMALAP